MRSTQLKHDKLIMIVIITVLRLFFLARMGQTMYTKDQLLISDHQRPVQPGLGLGLEPSGLGLGLETSGLGLGLGLEPPGLDHNTASAPLRPPATSPDTCSPTHNRTLQ